MRRIIFLLLCAVATAQSDTSSTNAPNRKASSASCPEDIIPGLNQMTRGVDITKLDLLPMKSLHPDGFRQSVIQFTCTGSGRSTWRNPFDEATYRQPDQVSAIGTLPGGVLDTRTQLISYSSKYKQTRGIDLLGNTSGAFSSGNGVKELLERIYRANISFAEMSSSVSSYAVNLTNTAHLPLDPNFDHFLRTRLTQPFEVNAQPYIEFISTFGTHYFDSAQFGGILYQRSVVDQEYLLKVSDSELQGNLTLTFGGRVRPSAEAAEDRQKISPHFKEYSWTEFRYYGGQPVKFSLADTTGFMRRWLPLVPKNPWLFGGSLKPIESLISNRTIREGIAKASALHRGRAAQGELKKTLEALKGYRISLEEDRILNQIEAKLSKQTEVAEAIKQIEQFLAKLEYYRAIIKLHPIANELYLFHSMLLCIEPNIQPKKLAYFKAKKASSLQLQDRIGTMRAAKDSLNIGQVLPVIREVNRLITEYIDEPDKEKAMQFTKKFLEACKNDPMGGWGGGGPRLKHLEDSN